VAIALILGLIISLKVENTFLTILDIHKVVQL